jgi:hypothetical protein
LDRTKWHRKHWIWYIGHLTKSMESRGRKSLLVNTTEKKDIDILQRRDFSLFLFQDCWWIRQNGVIVDTSICAVCGSF